MGKALSDLHKQALNNIKKVVADAKKALMKQGIIVANLAQYKGDFDLVKDVAALLAAVPAEKKPQADKITDSEYIGILIDSINGNDAIGSAEIDEFKLDSDGVPIFNITMDEVKYNRGRFPNVKSGNDGVIAAR